MVRSQVSARPGSWPGRGVDDVLSARKSRISGTRISTIRSASVRLRIRGGSMRMTRSRVTLMSRPASSARSASAPGRASSMPSIRPRPRISVTPGVPASAAASDSRRCAPTAWALSSRFSDSMASSTASPAAQASGPPPKVVPWLPGVSTPAAGPAASMAPMGTPPARPLASVITSGRMPAHWCANHLPLRPMPDCTSSIISSQPRSVQSWRSACR